MENLLLIFENISSVNRALIIVSGITIFWVIEGIVPFKFLNYRKWRHSIPNFLLTLTTIIVNFFFAFLFFIANVIFFNYSTNYTGGGVFFQISNIIL